MPLCAKDVDALTATQTLTFFKEININSNIIATYNLFGSITYSTTTTNYDALTTTFGSVQTRTFLTTDQSGGSSGDSAFELTLLPATIGMTVSTSTAGYNYNAAGTAITGSYNDKILPYLGPYQLKYGEQLNFSCDNTTKMAVYSSAKNNTSPLIKDLSASNNYSSNQILKNRCLYVFICFY